MILDSSGAFGAWNSHLQDRGKERAIVYVEVLARCRDGLEGGIGEGGVCDGLAEEGREGEEGMKEAHFDREDDVIGLGWALLW